MASSGTAAAPTINFRFKPQRGREEVMIGGEARVKSTAVIDAGDLTLKTIKSFIATPKGVASGKGGATGLYGSVNTAGSLMNAVTMKTLRGSTSPITGTTHIGTIAGGTAQFSFLCIGA